jgi:hypothetical protein
MKKMLFPKSHPLLQDNRSNRKRGAIKVIGCKTAMITKCHLEADNSTTTHFLMNGDSAPQHS